MVSSPGAVWVAMPPPPGPVAAWKSTNVHQGAVVGVLQVHLNGIADADADEWARHLEPKVQ